MIKNKKNLSERLLPFAVVLIFALSLGVSMYMKKHNLGLERLIGLEGGGMVMAIFIALLLFAIKGVVMFIPLSGLYLAVGAVMNDEITAFLVNLTGIVICLSIAYFNGTKITVERAEEIYRKFPKIKMLDDFESENSLLFSFLIRIFGIVPCDVVSMYCGIKKIPYKEYLLGSVAGMIPGLILTGIIGANITNPLSVPFLGSCALQLAGTLGSLYIYKKKIKRKDKPA